VRGQQPSAACRIKLMMTRSTAVLRLRLNDALHVFTNDRVCFASGIPNESNYRIRTKIRRVSLSSVDSTSSADKRPERVNNIAIIGGGLAGLSSVYHLLELSRHPLQITIYDKSKVGDGGASSVAGG
jgi:hypothetical protein